MDEIDRPEYSVAQFFPNDEHEYLCRFVPFAEAWRTFDRMTKTLGARLGTTTRVIITDGGDCTCVEWKFGEGLAYPTREMLEAWNRKSSVHE